MQLDYTDQDSERVRKAEGSSAGQPTQHLTAFTSEGAPTTTAPRNNNPVALALLGIGMVLLLGQFWPSRGAMTAGMILLTIASCFLFFALWKHIYGLLIPGAILAGLSVGVAFAAGTGGVSVLWGLALGFLAILFVGRALFTVQNNWPIYPAVPLFAVGVIVALAQVPAFLAGGLVWLPLLLIGAGLYLGWGRRQSV